MVFPPGNLNEKTFLKTNQIPESENGLQGHARKSFVQSKVFATKEENRAP